MCMMRHVAPARRVGISCAAAAALVPTMPNVSGSLQRHRCVWSCLSTNDFTPPSTQSEWFCKDCVLAQVAAAEAAAAAAAAKYKPNKLKRGPLSSAGKGPGRPPKRLRMSAPQIRGQHRRNKGNGSRNKLLFTRSNGALQVCCRFVHAAVCDGVHALAAQDGMRVRYVMHGNTLMEGTVVIGRTSEDVSGILCDCCSAVISCSSFEAHAGYANRRAPYDNILTPDGTSLRVLADAMAGVADAYVASALRPFVDDDDDDDVGMSLPLSVSVCLYQYTIQMDTGKWMPQLTTGTWVAVACAACRIS